MSRYISLERLIEDSKERYYDVLNRTSERWHEGGHAILPWWEFSLGILIAAYKEFEDRVGIIRSRRGAKTAWVRDAIDQLPEEFGVGELVCACSGVSRPMIRIVLEALRKEGKLEVLGTGRGAYWGRKKAAKKESNRVRREADKNESQPASDSDEELRNNG